ncbi:glycosyltransferase family 4 protein [uncultured Cyclobacterium sp.]|uniref:glycosyltransferase family 4 protein n=1 Tax=uncultured Cyclobacterium sp. TaxID=453820 RepID=UPI0030EB3C88|tara:strand:- start:115172 stop:116302 length:1131 start_codon:yes stop_codon:yes gene_type:complete
MKNNPKILFLLHLPPPFHGSSIVGLNIKSNAVINRLYDCFYINLLASNQVTESGKISLGKILVFFNTFFRVFKYLLIHRPKICYFALTVTGAALYKDFILVLLLKVFSVKPLYHLHNKGVISQKDNVIHRFVYNYVFKGSDVIILSQHLYSDISLFVPNSNVHVCPNGVKDENMNICHNLNKDISVDKLPIVSILFLSNLIESKGVFILMEALSILKKKGVAFKCVVIGSEGDVSSSQFNKRKAKLGLEDLVSYEGKKYGSDKIQAFLDADIFAFPTYYNNECFPLVLLEAMSYSLPIVSTYEGGIKDIVENEVNGFLTIQKDPNLLAISLESLVENPILRQRMGKAGRSKYEKEFTDKIFQNRLLKILKDVLQKS